LQFYTNKESTDTKRSPATTQFHDSIPVILDETHTISKYMQNSWNLS